MMCHIDTSRVCCKRGSHFFCTVYLFRVMPPQCIDTILLMVQKSQGQPPFGMYLYPGDNRIFTISTGELAGFGFLNEWGWPEFSPQHHYDSLKRIPPFFGEFPPTKSRLELQC